VGPSARDFVDFVDFDASVASPKQAGLRTSSLGGVGECVEDVIDVVAAGRTAGPLALGETLPPRRLKEGEQSLVASVPYSSFEVVVVDDTPVVVVVVVVVVVAP
jgi:hypothetical protein